MGRNKKGFTLVELMVTIAIIGILLASAVPVFRTWQQRARGSEATIMLDHILTAEYIYYIDNNEFYPSGSNISIYHDGGMEPGTAVEDVKENLNITIPQGHFINYEFYAIGDLFYLVMSSHGGFEIFKGTPEIYASMDKNGKIEIVHAGAPDY